MQAKSSVLNSILIFLFSCNLTVAECHSADLTGDNFVDFKDFSVMSDQWLNNVYNCNQSQMDISITNYRAFPDHTIDQILNGNWVADHRNPVMDMEFFAANNGHPGGAADPRVIDGDLFIFHEQVAGWAIPGSVYEDVFLARYQGAGWENLSGNQHIGQDGAQWQWVTDISYPSGSAIELTTDSNHGLTTGDKIGIMSADSLLNNANFIVTKVDDVKFTLDGTDGDNGDPNCETAQIKKISKCLSRVAPRVLYIPEVQGGKYIMWHGDYNDTNWDYSISASNDLTDWERFADEIITNTGPHKEVVRVDDTIYIFGGAGGEASGTGYYTQSVSDLNNISSFTEVLFPSHNDYGAAGSLVKCKDGWLMMNANPLKWAGSILYWSATDSGFPDSWTYEGQDTIDALDKSNTSINESGGTYTYDDEGYRNPTGLTVNGIPMLIVPTNSSTSYSGVSYSGGIPLECGFWRLAMGSTHKKKVLDLSMLGLTGSTSSNSWTDIQPHGAYQEIFIDPVITGQEWALRGRINGGNTGDAMFRLYDARNSETLFQWSGLLNFESQRLRFHMPARGKSNQRWEFQIKSPDGSTTVSVQSYKSQPLRAIVPIDRLPVNYSGGWSE